MTTAQNTPIRLHLKTQRDQPYGSERRKCEKCGIMIWIGPPSDGGQWTDEPSLYANPPEGYEACRPGTGS